jgi:hypothetical protein
LSQIVRCFTAAGLCKFCAGVPKDAILLPLFFFFAKEKKGLIFANR